MVSGGTKMKKYNFAIVGLGRISKRHLDAISNNPNAVLYAVCDIVKEKINRVKTEYKPLKTYSDFDEMIKDKNIDIVNIATPSGLHAEMAIKALKAGKHVVLEKPMALSIRDANRIIEAVKETHQKLMVVFQNRYNKAVQKLKDADKRELFGKKYLANATVRWSRPQSYYDQDNWHGTIAMDGGCLLNQSIHNIDLLLWMMGDVDKVAAFVDRFNHKHEVEDAAVASIRFKSGALGVIESTVNIYDKNLEETLSVFGTKGTAVLSGIANNEIKIWKFDELDEDADDVMKVFREDFEGDVYGTGHRAVIKEIIDSIENNHKPLTSEIEGKKAVELILAILKSSKTGKVIKLPLPQDSGDLHEYY